MASLINILACCFLFGTIRCQSSMPEDCNQSLGSTLPSSHFKATSVNSSTFVASEGKINSTYAWIPKTFDKIGHPNPELLQVDLGKVRTITGVKTQGYNGAFVKKFRIFVQQEKRLFSYQNAKGEASFTVPNANTTFNYLCPTKARYIAFVPVEFEKYIALKVDVYGCDEAFTVDGGSIDNLHTTKISQDRISISWTLRGKFDKQTVSFKEVNGSTPWDKFLKYDGEKKYVESIVNLKSCTAYEIVVTAESSCSKPNKKLIVSTLPPAPNVPELISGIATKPFTVVLKWRMPKSATPSCSSSLKGYRIKYKRTASLNYMVISIESPSATETTITGLSPWTNYEFSILAVGQFFISEASAKLSVSVYGEAPKQPANITSLRANPPDAFTITWQNPPSNTANGRIIASAVSFRKKSSTHWKVIPTYLSTEQKVTSLSTGTTYEVFVTLFNSRGNISTEVNEIFVGRKDPVESEDLANGTSASSGSPGILTISWKIPRHLNEENPESISIKIRKLGEQLERVVYLAPSRGQHLFDSLEHWRVYEYFVTLTTSKGVYLTKGFRALINGTRQEKTEVVKIDSAVSNKIGTMDIKVTLPEQFVKYTKLRCTLRYWKGAAGSRRLNIMPKTATFTQTIKDLDLWKKYTFQIVVTFVLERMKIFASPRSTVLVIGNSPGKAPSDIEVTQVGTTSISVSWQPIPQEYIRGKLSGYSVFYSKEGDTETVIKKARETVTSLLLNGLIPETTYSIKIAGTNEFGQQGPFSDAVTVKTLKDPRPPAQVRAKVLSATKVLVNWTFPLDPAQRMVNFTITADNKMSESIMINYLYRKTDEEMRTKTEYGTKMEGLRPNTGYAIFVVASKVTNGRIKYSDRSNIFPIFTFQDPPPPRPRLDTAEALSATVIEVKWTSMIELKETTQNYTIVAVKKDGKKLKFYALNYRSRQDMRKSRTYSKMLSNLEPFTSYRIHVFASKKIGMNFSRSDPSNEVAVETKEAAPTAPLNLAIKEEEAKYSFTWQEPLKANGVIRKYLFELYDMETSERVLKRTISGTGDRMVRVTDKLSPYRQHKASLKAFTIQPGPAAEKTFVTAEGFPSAPRDVTVYFNGSHMVINWKKPAEENGKILRYQVHLTGKRLGKKDPIANTYVAPPQRQEFFIQESSYGSDFAVEVAAETSKGAGPNSKRVMVFLDPPKLAAPPQPDVMMDEIKPTTMIVKLKPLVRMSYSLLVSIYQVIIEIVNGGALQKRAVTSIPNKVRNYTTALKNGAKFYVAAEFKANNLPEEFVIGDGKTYNGYRNTPLNPGTVYKVHVRAVAMDGNGNPVYGQPASVRLPATAPRKSEKAKNGGIPLPIIAGIAGALLLLIILVAIIILYLRSGSVARRRSKDRKEAYDIELSKMRTKMDPSQQRPVSLTGDFPLHPDHIPIPFVNYSKQVSKMHRNEKHGFKSEYAQLEMGKEFSWEVAHQTENKPKNRFANIVAYDHARVILTKIDGNTGSDYINASYIDGFMKPNAYVATQGPLPGTFNDFWRMIWELRSSVVVMLTNLQEKNKLKCHKYWPDDCIEYGEIIVTLTRKELYADYSIRTFLLEKPDARETREVKHFHFTVWPDHGVPKYATAILAFRRRVRSYNNPDSGPTVVHCSAGVGRTGTYIALDAMLDRMNGQSDVDIFNFIAAMRTRRIAMVQTEEQYIFIYDAILESVQCGNTEITAQDLRIMINKLDIVSLETKMTGFEKEWKILNNVSPIPSKSACSVAALPENMVKNRNQTACILPADNSLVRLLTIEDDEATSYINAVYVDGYKQRNAFILTQSPLKNTVMDFWRMLCEHKSASVVLLSSLDEGEDFEKFWPEKHIREYEMVTVECLSKIVGGDEATLRSTARRGESDLVVRQFRVEDTRYPEYPLMVKLFQYIGWTETKVPSNCNTIIQLVNQLERWQQQSGNGPVTIICSDGIGRSGAFAALNAVLERVKMEQVVDVFQAIKAMRIQRAHVVKTLEQYKFIYNAVEEYLNAFDDYANFK